MNELKLVLNTKNVRKVACAAGIGWTVGKFIGGALTAFIGGALTAVYSDIIPAISKTSKPVKKDEEETKE